jgi:hypothetical protein
MRLKHVLTRGCVALAALAAALVGATSSSAATPVQVKGIDISTSFPATGLSAICGFPVTISVSGTMSSTLWTNSDGLVARELDTFPGTKVTLSGPSGSFTFEGNLVGHTDYPQGATLGAPATETFTGLTLTIPGSSSALSGLLVIADMTVVGFAGPIPLTSGGDVTTVEGNPNGVSSTESALCPALG